MATPNPNRTAKIYNEYDAERRAEEIAAIRLESMVVQISEMTQNTLALMKTNQTIWKELQEARKATRRMTQTVICYEETYSRLPKNAKAAFNAIEKEVVKQYGLSIDGVNKE